MKPQKSIIKITLIAFNPHKLNSAAHEIIMLVQSTGSEIIGPIPLPSKTKNYIVTRSPHIDKDSREKFEIRWHRRLFYIADCTSTTIEAITKMTLPAGVEFEVTIENNDSESKQGAASTSTSKADVNNDSKSLKKKAA